MHTRHSILPYRHACFLVCAWLPLFALDSSTLARAATTLLQDGTYVFAFHVDEAGDDFGGTKADFTSLDNPFFLDLERAGRRPITGTIDLGSDLALVLTLELTGAVDYGYPLKGTFNLSDLDFVVDGIPSRIEKLTYNAAATRIGQYQHAGQFIPPDIFTTSSSAFITYGYSGSGLAGDRPQVRFNFTTAPTPDLNFDGGIDAADAGIMFGNWGLTGLGDLNIDLIVDAADASILFAEWTGDERSFRSVPEPTTLFCAATLMGLVFSRRSP